MHFNLSAPYYAFEEKKKLWKYPALGDGAGVAEWLGFGQDVFNRM